MYSHCVVNCCHISLSKYSTRYQQFSRKTSGNLAAVLVKWFIRWDNSLWTSCGSVSLPGAIIAYNNLLKVSFYGKDLSQWSWSFLLNKEPMVLTRLAIPAQTGWIPFVFFLPKLLLQFHQSMQFFPLFAFDCCIVVLCAIFIAQKVLCKVIVLAAR